MKDCFVENKSEKKNKKKGPIMMVLKFRCSFDGGSGGDCNCGDYELLKYML